MICPMFLLTHGTQKDHGCAANFKAHAKRHVRSYRGLALLGRLDSQQKASYQHLQHEVQSPMQEASLQVVGLAYHCHEV